MTQTQERTQDRGHCQCCGREQAIVGRTMSKHGYRVDHGWFSGVCRGEHYEPIEVSRAYADETIAFVLTDCEKLDEQARRLHEGLAFPKFVTVRRFRRGSADLQVPFLLSPYYSQIEAVREATYAAESRARAGRRFAADLGRICDEYHGKPVVTITKPTAAAPLSIGERRIRADGHVLTMTGQSGPRVSWVLVKNEKKYSGWTGVGAWRKLSLAPVEAPAAA